MGCPSAAIVVEELVQLGATRLVRVGTCGGLQPTMHMADLVVAVAATPEDRTAFTYTDGEPHAPTAGWRSSSAAVALAREQGARLHVGPIVSSAVFYDPDPGRFRRWRRAGHLGVEMEAAVLYTHRRPPPGRGPGRPDGQRHASRARRSTRISDEELKQGVDR